jgi:nitrogen regulatory protein PII
MRRDITILTDLELITCIVQKGEADNVVKAAYSAGAQGATIYYARGSGVKERMGIFGVAVDAEKEIINIVVSEEQSNRVFDAMYLAGELDTPGKGFIFVTKLEKAGTFIPQEIIKKLNGE